MVLKLRILHHLSPLWFERSCKIISLYLNGVCHRVVWRLTFQETKCIVTNDRVLTIGNMKASPRHLKLSRRQCTTAQISRTITTWTARCQRMQDITMAPQQWNVTVLSWLSRSIKRLVHGNLTYRYMTAFELLAWVSHQHEL